MSEEMIQRIIELHKSGISIQEIADEFDVSLVTIKRRIAAIRKTHDLPWRSKSKQKTRTDRAEHDDESTPWNIELSRKYMTRQWSTATC